MSIASARSSLRPSLNREEMPTLAVVMGAPLKFVRAERIKGYNIKKNLHHNIFLGHKSSKIDEGSP